jgi:hypothetical protein
VELGWVEVGPEILTIVGITASVEKSLYLQALSISYRTSNWTVLILTMNTAMTLLASNLAVAAKEQVFTLITRPRLSLTL